MKSILLALLTVASAAHAFCGFYVAGGGAGLFNNATQVVLMREGTKTVLSMQNNYQGPPENFAMVIPVPVVLQKENVKTLPREVFVHVDQLDAPRLVEYWEYDPCESLKLRDMREQQKQESLTLLSEKHDPVKVEARFTVGEYQIVVLSAKDALGLEAWLRQNKYQIPAGAEALFRPYVEQGMKFFVARVDVKKVEFKDGMAMLSPLRFHYDSEKFELPVRLGLINSKDKQDLIIHVLARDQRYEVANYPNAIIPTNLDLVPSAKSEFGAFYVSLFDRTLQKNPGAVITEYAWQATRCDPCPVTPLTEGDLFTLGADVVSKDARADSFVLTRLHARYDKTSLGEDLVFKAVAAIEGGREHDRLADDSGLRQTAIDAKLNNFQGRYAIRYPWAGAVECKDPIRGLWGEVGPGPGRLERPVAVLGTAFEKRELETAARLAEADVPALDIKGRKRVSGRLTEEKKPEPSVVPAPTVPTVPTKKWWEFWK